MKSDLASQLSNLSEKVLRCSRENRPSTCDDRILTLRLGELYNKVNRAKSANERDMKVEIQSLMSQVQNRGNYEKKNSSAKFNFLAAPPANNNCANATVIGDGTFAGTLVDATGDGSSSCDFESGNPDVWFKYVAPANQTVVFDLFNDFLNVLSIHSSCPGTIPNEITCGTAEDYFPALNVTIGSEYLIRVASRFGSTGSFTLTAGIPASISGAVTDNVNSLPIPFVNVALFDEFGNFLRFVQTSLAGSYEFSGLPAGTYFLRTQNDQLYIDEVYDNIPCIDSSCDPEDGTPVVVTSGSAVTANFALDLGGAISGAVSDSDNGLPIVDSTIFVYNSDGDWATQTQTDWLGNYAVGGLPQGSYFIRTSSSQNWIDELYDNIPCSESCDVTTGTPINVSVNQITSGINFVLNEGGKISGNVSSSLGGGIPFAGVRIFDQSGNFVDSAGTDAFGNYYSNGLTSGNYFVVSDVNQYVNEVFDDIPCSPICDPLTGTPVAVVIEEETVSINFVLQPGGSLSGQVTDSFSIPVDARVRVYDASGNYNFSTVADQNGNYVVSGLLPGTYYVTASHSAYQAELYDNIPCPALDCDPLSGTGVAVQVAQNTPNIDFELVALGRIAGSVTDSVTGAGLPFIRIRIYDALANSVTSDQTNALGYYVAGGLNTGSYYVISEESSIYLSEVYPDQICPSGQECDPNTGTLVPVTAGATTPNIDLALDLGGTISGKLTDTNGETIKGRVDVFDANGNFVQSNSTDFSGEYLIAGLSSANYFVFGAGDGNFIDELFDDIPCVDGGCEITSGTPVPVIQGASTDNVDLELIRCSITIQPTILPDAFVGVFYSVPFSASGGVEPYSFEGWFLPNWLSLSSDGLLSGVPTSADEEFFRISTTDSQGCEAEISLNLTILDSQNLYTDDFEDGVIAPDWDYIKPAWSESNGYLQAIPSGRKATAIAAPVFPGCQFCSFESVMQTSGGAGNRVWMLAWYIDKNNTIELLMKEETDRWILKQRSGGAIVTKAKAQGSIESGRDYRVLITYTGIEFHVYIDGSSEPIITMSPAAPVTAGTVGFQVKSTTGNFDELLVR